MWIYIITLFTINYHSAKTDCPNGISECVINHMRQWEDTIIVEKKVYCQKNAALYKLKEIEMPISGFRPGNEYVVFDSVFVKK